MRSGSNVFKACNIVWIVCALGFGAQAMAAGVADFSSKDAASGLKEALTKGAGQAAQFGLLDKKDADLDSYVTQKALDGLFLLIAEQEKTIRKDPVGSGSNLLKKVFGALGK